MPTNVIEFNHGFCPRGANLEVDKRKNEVEELERQRHELDLKARMREGGKAKEISGLREWLC